MKSESGTVKNQHNQINRNIVVNNARDKLNISVVISDEKERPKKLHKTYWDTTPFQRAVRWLQIEPINQRTLAFIEKVNNDIQAHNTEKGYNPGRGKFPLKYL